MPNNNDLSDWHKAIIESSNLDKQQNKKFMEDFPPIEELNVIDEDGDKSIIGIFDIGNEIYWASKLPNGTYSRHSLIKVPNVVCRFIAGYFSKIKI